MLCCAPSLRAATPTRITHCAEWERFTEHHAEYADSCLRAKGWKFYDTMYSLSDSYGANPDVLMDMTRTDVWIYGASDLPSGWFILFSLCNGSSAVMASTAYESEYKSLIAEMARRGYTKYDGGEYFDAKYRNSVYEIDVSKAYRYNGGCAWSFFVFKRAGYE